ncbi:MAG: hypothetical protein AAF357_13895, partial [Verrucomicrobiota bacterium]
MINPFIANLDWFLDQLRGQGMVVPAEREVLLRRLLLSKFRQDELPESLDRFLGLAIPVLCADPDDRPLVREIAGRICPPSQTSQIAAPSGRKRRSLWIAVAGTLLVGLFAVGIWVFWPKEPNVVSEPDRPTGEGPVVESGNFENPLPEDSDTTPEIPTSPQNSPQPDSPAAPVVPGAPELPKEDESSENGEITEDQADPSPRELKLDWQRIGWAAVAATILLVTVVILGRKLPFFRLKRRLAEPLRADSRDSILHFEPGPTFGPDQLQPIARRLHRHRRSPGSIGLQVGRTLTATIRNAGFFVPVFADRILRPRYLILAENSGFGDHRAGLAREIYRGLRSLGVDVRYYFYREEPDLLYPAEDDGHDDVAVHQIEDLHRLTPDHRLLVFSSGNLAGSPLAGPSGFGLWKEGGAWFPDHSRDRLSELGDGEFVTSPGDVAALDWYSRRLHSLGQTIANERPQDDFGIPSPPETFALHREVWTDAAQPSERPLRMIVKP